MRKIALGLALCLAPVTAWAEIVGAGYDRPVARYGHDILGDTPEWGALRLRMSDGQVRTHVLPGSEIFEDIAPRLADLDGDGSPEVIAVQTSVTQGARLSVWDQTGLVAATPYIGRAHRWLAPLGAADLDGDGKIEIAYVEKPHLAKVLKVWRFDAGKLVLVTEQAGLTNHKIGWAFIAGGIRVCAGQGPVMVTASGDWQNVMETTLTGGRLRSVVRGAYRGPESLEAALSCR